MNVMKIEYEYDIINDDLLYVKKIEYRNKTFNFREYIFNIENLKNNFRFTDLDSIDLEHLNFFSDESEYLNQYFIISKNNIEKFKEYYLEEDIFKLSAYEYMKKHALNEYLDLNNINYDDLYMFENKNSTEIYKYGSKISIKNSIHKEILKILKK